MNYDITPIERMVLESLNKGSKSSTELFECTGISPHILTKITISLISKNLIVMKDKKYSMNKSLSSEMKQLLTRYIEKKFEALELMGQTIDLSVEQNQKQYPASFHLKKVAMTKTEKAIFKGLTHQLESFLKELEKKNRKNLTSEQELIFWGAGNYGNIIQTYISN